MNPQVPASAHLTEAQFGELVAAVRRASDVALTAAEQHVLGCEQCAAELASLREALTLFRESTTTFANTELQRIPPVVLPTRPASSPALRSMMLATAATLVIAAFVPMQMLLHERSQRAAQQAARAGPATGVQHYATESNEDLLEDVDNAASASVPDSMQALADPTADTDLSVRKSN